MLGSLAPLTTAPFLESVIEYLKDEWNFPVKLAPLAALLLGSLISVGVAAYTHQDLYSALLIGLGTGFASSFWHEITKSN